MQEVEQRVHKDVLRRKQLCEKIQIEGGGADFCVYCSFLQESAHYLLLNDLCFKAMSPNCIVFSVPFVAAPSGGNIHAVHNSKLQKKDSHVHI